MDDKESQNSSRVDSIRDNHTKLRLKLKNSLKPICLQMKNVKKCSQESYSPRKKRIRRTSENLTSFTTINFKGQSIKEQFQDNYQIINKIGEGGHSVVYECRSYLDNTKYAVKFTRKNDEQSLQRLKQQYQILRILNHQSIIKGSYLFLDQKKLTCHLVCQFCNYPDLRAFIHKSNPVGRSEDTVAQIIQRILVAVQYLHDKSVCHRDLKPENVLFDQLSAQIKIIDFQIAKMARHKDDKLEMWTRTGTIHYRAPESFVGGYNELVDCWAIGVMAYELLTNKLPFNNPYELQLITKIRQSEPQIDTLPISEYAKTFLRRLLDKDPRTRITAKECLSHPFILTHATESITSPNIKLNRSFDEQDDRQRQQKQKPSFYDLETDLSFTQAIIQDIGIRFCGQQ